MASSQILSHDDALKVRDATIVTILISACAVLVLQAYILWYEGTRNQLLKTWRNALLLAATVSTVCLLPLLSAPAFQSDDKLL